MSLIRPVGYETLSCGCRLGRYLSMETGREIAYLEAKGPDCDCRRHQQNRPVSASRRSQTVAPPHRVTSGAQAT